MGSSGLPWRRASVMMRSPAATTHSLFARPTVLPALHGFVGGFQSGDADNGADHEVGIGMGGDFHRAGGAVHDFDGVAEAGILQLVVRAGRRASADRHRDSLRMPAARLLEGQLDIVAGSQADDGEAVGESFNDVEGALADGAGGAEDGDAFHAELKFMVAHGTTAVCNAEAVGGAAHCRVTLGIPSAAADIA